MIDKTEYIHLPTMQKVRCIEPWEDGLAMVTPYKRDYGVGTWDCTVATKWELIPCEGIYKVLYKYRDEN